jgi:Uracil DNA glycosylase
MEVRIDPSWQKRLAREFGDPYFADLAAFVKKEYANETVYPPPSYIFRAFDLCPFEKVKVVILGQDPYHGTRQANGLAFAVDAAQTVPPSLENIFKEIESDIGKPLTHTDGDLPGGRRRAAFAERDTYRSCARSRFAPGTRMGTLHRRRRYRALRGARPSRVHALGKLRKTKRNAYRPAEASVLEAPHPSPFSAANGFFGSKHFSPGE